MLVRDETTVATTQAVHLSPQTEHFALQNQADDFALVRSQLFMQPASRVYGRIGHTDLFHLFEVEKTFAIRQGV